MNSNNDLYQIEYRDPWDCPRRWHHILCPGTTKLFVGQQMTKADSWEEREEKGIDRDI